MSPGAGRVKAGPSPCLGLPYKRFESWIFCEVGQGRKRWKQFDEQGVELDRMSQIAEDFLDIPESGVGKCPVEIVAGLFFFLVDRLLETGDRALLVACARPGMPEIVPGRGGVGPDLDGA